MAELHCSQAEKSKESAVYIALPCCTIIKVVVYSLLMNYSYETFYCCWGESLLLAQIPMV